MSNFIKNVYKSDRKLARLLILLIFIQLTVAVLRVEITPFFVYAMFSWEELRPRSDTMSFVIVKIGDKKFPKMDIMQLRCNNDFLPNAVAQYFHQPNSLSDSSINEKFKRRIPKAIIKNTPNFLKNIYKENIPSLINEINTSGITMAGIQKNPKWLSSYIQEKENNYRDSVSVYILKVQFHNGKFDTLQEKRIL